MLNIFCLGLFALAALSSVAAQQKVVMCYFEEWAVYRPSYGFFDVESIDPFICTHLQFAFAGLNGTTYEIESLDPSNDYNHDLGLGAYKRFTNLKIQNPNLKTYLACGGWSEGSIKYSEMVSTAERRKIFIDSVVAMLLEHNFDGLDMDWEYPGGRPDSPGSPDDKDNYSALLREMRAEFDQYGFDMTAAVSADAGISDYGYDVPVMAETLDFINLMSYDYHGRWQGHAYTGINSPLYARPEEMDPESKGYHFNTDFSVNYWLDAGAKKEQLLMGMAAYGRGFTLLNEEEHGIYDTAIRASDPGPYSEEAGYLGYNEYCEKMYGTPESPDSGELADWTIVRDPDAIAPYTYSGKQWFAYDDQESFRVKSEYILEMGLGGAMVWSIDSDDFQDACGGGKFGLVKTIQEVLNGVISQDVCEGEAGYHRDPEDCAHYYMCTLETDGSFDIVQKYCPGGLLWDTVNEVCNWPTEVDC